MTTHAEIVAISTVCGSLAKVSSNAIHTTIAVPVAKAQSMTKAPSHSPLSTQKTAPHSLHRGFILK
jgi:hypothetical protein